MVEFLVALSDILPDDASGIVSLGQTGIFGFATYWIGRIASAIKQFLKAENARREAEAAHRALEAAHWEREEVMLAKALGVPNPIANDVTPVIALKRS